MLKNDERCRTTQAASPSIDAALPLAVQLKMRKEWLWDNKSAIDAYNSGVEEQGAFSDSIRSF
jgi:antitoxin CcdA